MQLYAVKFGESSLQTKYIYKDAVSDDSTSIAWSYYVARFNTKTILFDVGFRDPMIARDWGIKLFNLDDEIHQIGDLNQVDVIFITHSHFDHIDNIDLFPNAQIIISYAEYGHAMSNGSPAIKSRLGKDNVIKVEDELIYEDTFLFKVVGGHSVGSSVVYFEHNEQKYVITGDECYTRDNLTQQIPIGIYSDTRKNETFIHNAYRDGWIPLPYHDTSLFQTYKRISNHIVQIL
ncbi:MBL fold metallo-hydrolase [Cohnella sp. AR92]|uniref:MBL fold metallo-hydrolase n=1 Tax=Cohnella sp. AR92 TaxID=648716 RepID=UPI000F8CB928|nr:MBL fold metallo-hydrolase [Cohnella sp. AR92]RUS45845.1 MBL fold metallo-hydrolase [Cohnella sp. AR92]